MNAVSVRVNGREHQAEVEPRLLLSDFLRHDLGLKGTHVGCEHGVCGCCTVSLNGAAVRSCLLFAVQANGAEILTIEGLSPADGLHPIQAAFRDAHGLQCGFCTPGFVMAVHAFLEENPRADLSDEEIREGLSGNLCRCTGYQNIVEAVRLASRELYGERG
jgi:carbon-monoxide dehydrogenase small subunit